MRVLLVEPRNCWTGLNIALGYLTASLKKAGHEVKVLDLTNHRDWPVERMERAIIESFNPDLIGIALFYISYHGVKEMIARIKSCRTTPILVGGPQMVIEKEEIMRDIPQLDFALMGDGEEALVELCAALEGKTDLGGIDGLIHRSNGRVIRNRDRLINKDVDSYLFPDYGPFGIERISRYTLITSRGCPHHCTYCFRSTPRWRPRSPENIVQELDHAISNYRIDEFVIVDDAFNILPERIIAFCDMLEKSGIKMPWSCSGVRADRMTEELAARMRQAGCYSINIGIETLQPDLYDALNRGMTIDDLKRSIDLIKKYNFNTVAYFMIGLPGDTPEKTWDTYRKAKTLGIDYQSYSILLPFPDTRMHDIVYSMEGVRKLADYRTISTIWTFDPVFSRMKTAFDTPEYPAESKIEMYNKIRTLEGDPRPPYHKSIFLFALHAFWWVVKYETSSRIPATLFRLTRSFVSRLARTGGKSVSLTNNTYKESFLQEMQKLVETGNNGAGCAE